MSGLEPEADMRRFLEHVRNAENIAVYSQGSVAIRLAGYRPSSNCLARIANLSSDTHVRGGIELPQERFHAQEPRLICHLSQGW